MAKSMSGGAHAVRGSDGKRQRRSKRGDRWMSTSLKLGCAVRAVKRMSPSVKGCWHLPQQTFPIGR